MKALLQLQRCGLASLIAPGTLEFIVYGNGAKYRDWVAELTALDAAYGYERNFLRPQIDYSRADVYDLEGVIANYILETGKLYQVHEQVGLHDYIRYFCAVLNNGDIARLEEEAVIECLRNR